ncbi:hypothetical protein Gpo141_00011471 [Globisporangium polare]
MGVGIADHETKRAAWPQLLQETPRLCEGMFEAQVMCDQVRRRLEAIARALERCNSNKASSANDQDEQLQQLWATFADLVTRFVDFLERFVRREVVFRLTSKRVVVKTSKAFHEALDGFLKDAARVKDEPQDEVHEWHDRFDNACVNLHIVFQDLSRDRMALLRDLMDLQSQQEALTLIMYEYKRPAGTYTAPELQVIQNAFNTITRFSRAKAPVVPKWFIPPHDVEFERDALTENQISTGVEVHRGTYGEAAVLVTFVRAELEPQQREAFEKAVASWFQYGGQHPHLSRLYGASHVGELFFATERLSENGSLDVFVAKNPSLLWEKLYEAAQGLQFLHEQKLVHGDVAPSSVIINAEGAVKIADNIVASLDLPNSTNEASWRRAPENLHGDESAVPTFASDVYAFGSCITQTAKLASSLSEPDTVDQFPTESVSLSEDQSTLLRQMCAELPEQRPDMTLVVNKLREYAEAEQLSREQRHAAELAANAAKLVVRRHTSDSLPARRHTFDSSPPTASWRHKLKETKEQRQERRKRDKEAKENQRRHKKSFSRQSSDSKCVLQ